MAVSARPISARPLSGDIEEAAVQQGVFKRQFRAPVAADRYPGIGDEASAAQDASAQSKTPIYDALPPDRRAIVDRFIVSVRLAQRA